MNLRNHGPSLPLLVTLCLIFSSTACHKTFEGDQHHSSAVNASNLTSTQPNIILILADDVGYEIPTYTGGQSFSTPNIDFMAANGIQFPYFSSHPDGPPSRLALMTGKYNFRNWNGFGSLSAKSKTIGNMLHDANYATCFTGKWQFDGGDTSIRNHGFDKYLAFVPFKPVNNNDPDQGYRRYKNPLLYENGAYLPDSVVEGKYSEDLLSDYASNFIDSNLTKPFFLVYSCNLAQRPWSPTPDNPDFANWDPAVEDINEDKKYFPDMIAYMDKIIGKIINKVEASGISNNTVIIFTSDNATNRQIFSTFKGTVVGGSKSLTTARGLKVPMVVYWPGTVSPGRVDTSLADMTDILPTLANIAGIPQPTTWGKLDGITFYDNLVSISGKQRTYDYCFWPGYYKHPVDNSFVYDYTYKLYDSLNGGNFYNIRLDPDELSPIPENSLTPAENSTKQKFKRILSKAVTKK